LPKTKPCQFSSGQLRRSVRILTYSSDYSTCIRGGGGDGVVYEDKSIAARCGDHAHPPSYTPAGGASSSVVITTDI